MRARFANPEFHGRTVGELVQMLRAYDPGMPVVLDGTEGFVVRTVGSDLRLERRELATRSIASDELNASNDG